mmetsp:Transcript_4399/g.14059  ORF Transcript_4399/g.14059 Transcript_4399/m.14059 type:complete len:108 (-) Transcript_4399:63-386(-)
MADQACAYAALLLHDSDAEVNGKNIAKVLAAAGIECRPTLPLIFGEKLAGKSIGDMIDSAAEAPSTAAAPAAAAAAAPAAGGAAAKAPAKKVEVEEEDDDMGMGLFD